MLKANQGTTWAKEVFSSNTKSQLGPGLEMAVAETFVHTKNVGIVTVQNIWITINLAAMRLWI